MDVETIHEHKIKFPEVVIDDGRLISVIVENEELTIAVSGNLNRNMTKLVKNKMALCIADLLTINQEYDSV